MIGFVIALLEQNHKIKDWRIDIKKAVSKDSSSSNQGYSSNRGEGRGFNGGFGNFGRGFGDRERGGGGPAPWNSGPMGPPFSNEGMGGGWGGGMGGDMGGMGDGMGGGMGNAMDGPKVCDRQVSDKKFIVVYRMGRMASLYKILLQP